MTVEYQRSSVEYVNVKWTADVTLGAQAVQIAVWPTTRALQAADWRNASWAGNAGTTRTARVLVNFAALDAADAYFVHSKLTDNPEAPVKDAGVIRVND